MDLRKLLSKYYKENLSDEDKELFKKGKTIIKFEVRFGFDLDILGPTVDVNSWISKKGIDALAQFSQIEPEAMNEAVKEALDNFGYEVSKALSMAGDRNIAVVAEGFDNDASKRMADRLNRKFAENLNKKGETN